MIKRTIVLIAVALLTLACQASKVAPDGYYFEKAQYSVDSIVVNTIYYNDLSSMKTTARKLGIDESELRAFSVLSADKTRCTIHMIDPEVSYEPEFVGHELVHCLKGEWHPMQNK